MEPAEFVHALRPGDLPDTVRRQARRCLLDTAGVAFAGARTPMSRIIREHAIANFGSSAHPVRMLADGRHAGPVGAALAGAATIDSMDGHDGHDLTKGHAGVAVLPALLAFAELHRARTQAPAITGEEFLTRLVLGYEIGTRAGIALHGTVPEYHSSGAWNALACAAIGARSSNLDTERTEHALGLAEYHGPRSQMLRGIDDPTMVKDGSAWGAAAGVSAALLARDGYTGAPAVTTRTPEYWEDLGTRWYILEQYVKPYPVCRWAHPAITAAISVARQHKLRPADIAELEVHTFDPATRLAVHTPAGTEQAQYSLPFGVALAVEHLDVRPEHLITPGAHPLSERITIHEVPEFTARFPRERRATLRVTRTDGRVLETRAHTARGGPDDPLSDEELRAKARSYATPLLGEHAAERLCDAVDDLGTDSTPLLDILLSGPE